MVLRSYALPSLHALALRLVGQTSWRVRKGFRLDEGKGMGGVLLILEMVALAEMHEAVHTLSMWVSVASTSALANIGKA